MVGAQPAGGGLGGVGEVLQGLAGQQGGPLQPQVPGGQGGPEGPHAAGDLRAGNLPADLLLEGPEHRVVVEGAPLDHNVPA